MISQNIQAARKALGLTQEDLANRLSVARQTVAKWESGESLPDLEKCASNILYIDNGNIIGKGSLSEFKDRYRVAPLDAAKHADAPIYGIRETANGTSALVPARSGIGDPATLDDIMIHTAQEATL